MAVKSAERVFRIFELLEQSPEGLTNKEVSSLLGFAPSSTLALLQTMEENGYLSADEQKRYYLGGRLMSLGAVAASRIDLNKIGTPYLKKLMQTVEETCFLGVLSGDEIVYIAKENCERTITTNASIGSRKPVYCTGLGKAFLAFLPEKESSQIIDRIELKAFTEHTVTDKLELRKEIAQFRNQGYAVDNQEIEQGLWCMAVPIYDNTGHMKAAISVSGLKQRMVEKKELLKTEMLKTARDLSRDLGYYKEELK